MDPVTENLTRERDGLVTRANGLLQTVAEANSGAGRDLNSDEREVLGRYRGRITEIDSQLALTASDFSLNAEVAASIAKYAPGVAVQAREASPWPTPGAVLWDYLHRTQDRDAADRISKFQRNAQREAQREGGEGIIQVRAAQHMGTHVADTTAVAGGFDGLLVSPVSGPLLDLGWSGTPLLSALGTQQAPNGYSFIRPRLVDPHLNDGAGPQAGGKQKGELPSYAFTVDSETVSMDSVGGYLNVSQQVLSWVSGGLDIILRQLSRRTERAAEKAAVAVLAGTTKKITLSASADTAALMKAFGDAAAAVFAATGAMPTWLASGPAGWARLFGITDLAGRPLFPASNPVNAPGSGGSLNSFTVSVGGLPLTVTPGITGPEFYMGNSAGVEFYRANLPVLSVDEPSVLGRQIAVAVGLGSYVPITVESPDGGTTPAKREGVVKIAP